MVTLDRFKVMDLDNIRQSIADGKIEEAISILLDLSKNTTFYNEVLALAGNFRDLTANESLYTLQRFSTEKVRIRKQVLGIADRCSVVLGKSKGKDLSSQFEHNIVGPKTKILFLSANPDPGAILNFDKEVNEIEGSLKRSAFRDRFKFAQKRGITTRIIREAIRDEKPDIIHFSGHGAGEDGIVVLDDNEDAVILSNQAIEMLFEIIKTQVKCVILNACYSESQAKVITKHIPYVIGMDDAIEDSTSIAFAMGFYEALGDNQSFEQAYKYGRMVVVMENRIGADIIHFFVQNT